MEGATVPCWHAILQATMPTEHHAFFYTHGGRAFPQDLLMAANAELNQFVQLLEAEGVKVRRPDPVDCSRQFATPDWSSPAGLYTAMPRDCLLVIGDEIIEAPMAWRCRYFETFAYRSLLKNYFQQGARWSAAPRPQLPDALYQPVEEQEGEEAFPFRSMLSEYEPTFDAADYIRCGKDIFVQRSQVTNSFGIAWLRRHLGERYRIHELQFNDPHPMHLDATFVPLAPGKLLVNPERIRGIKLPEMLASWEVRYAAQPVPRAAPPLYMSSHWLSMNILMLDEERVVVEAQEEPLIAQLTSWGFKPLRCPFRHFQALGGSFHCATLDVRRRGGLQSYF
ncbi:hypothetical protein [Ktedonosporobacter rubrisoli]|uniref:hypothetical protein n=1 Tax=Ktedonosporobacter rubrisoli TaxID=2509675 RepID=UPI001A91AA1F|nr:hypothetical protein [Ktedonosporobacter rubrisoli]